MGLMLAFIGSPGPVSASSPAVKLYYDIIYEPENNSGVGYLEGSLAGPLSEPMVYVVPIPFENGSITIADVSPSSCTAYVEGDEIWVFLAENTTLFKVYFLLEDVLTEADALTYTLDVNIPDNSFMKFEAVGLLDVVAYPEADVDYSNETTIISFSSPGYYSVVMYYPVQMPTEVTEIPGPTQTTTEYVFSSTTTSQPSTESEAVYTSTSLPQTTRSRGVQEGAGASWSAYVYGIILVIGIAVIVTWIALRKSR